MIYIGVDIGNKGGIAVMDSLGLNIGQGIREHIGLGYLIPMPTVEVEDDDGKRIKMDEVAVTKFIHKATMIQKKGNNYFEPCKMVIEDINVYVNSQYTDMVAIKSMMIAHGIFRGIALSVGMECVVVHPKTWQKKMGCLTLSPKQIKVHTQGMSLEQRLQWEKENDSKALSIQACKRRFPGISLIPDNGRVPHNGMSDAALLAAYGFDMDKQEGRIQDDTELFV